MKSKYFTKKDKLKDEEGGILASLKMKEGKMPVRLKEKKQDLKLLAKNLMEKRQERLKRFDEPDLNIFQRQEKQRLLEKAKVPFIKQLEKDQELAFKLQKDLEENKKKQALEDIKILLADLKVEMKKSKNPREEAIQEPAMQEPAMQEEMGEEMGEENIDPIMAQQGILNDEEYSKLRQSVKQIIASQKQFKSEKQIYKNINSQFKANARLNRMPTNTEKLYPQMIRDIENELGINLNIDPSKRTKITGKGLRLTNKRGRGRPPKPKSEADVKVEKRPVGRPRKTPYVMPVLTEPRKVGKPRLKKTVM